MRRWILRIMMALVLLAIGYTWGHRSVPVVHAQQTTTNLTVPKAWGPVIGTMTGVLVLQDHNGVIRLVAADTGRLAEVITRN